MAVLKRYNINNLKTDQQNVKENFVRDLRRTGKVVFCVFWFMYALKHREYSPF